jgi:hypothetical protein
MLPVIYRKRLMMHGLIQRKLFSEGADSTPLQPSLARFRRRNAFGVTCLQRLSSV